MFIVDMTLYESDFIRKSTVNNKALDMRTYDIDHTLSLFAYYYEQYVHLKLRRYKDEETSLSDWNKLKAIGTIYPDIHLNDTEEIYLDMNSNQLHVKIPFSIYKRSDY
ncbi:MAG: hypothetical protein JJU16_05375 [Alkalibacterium sp.]|nr:hypothetical protein [Alkalibacterium sp.]